MIRRLLALAALGLRALVHYLVRPFRRLDAQEGAFVRQFLDDALLPTPGARSDLIVAASRCTGCGLCDALCAREGRRPVGVPGPSYVPLAVFRALPDLAAARGDLATFRACGDCRACEAWCPYGVPVVALLDDARATLERLDRLSAGPPAA